MPPCLSRPNTPCSAGSPTSRPACRAPSLVAAVVRDGEIVWSGGRGRVGGPAARDRHPVPAGLDHQDPRRHRRHAAARRRPARPQRPARKARPGHAVRRRHRRPAAVPHLRPDVRIARPVVGADPGRRLGRAGRQPRRGRDQAPAGREVPLLERRLRRARRAHLAPPRQGLALGARRGGPRPARDDPHHAAPGRRARRRLRRAPLRRRPPAGAEPRRRRDGPRRAAVVDGDGPRPLDGVPRRPRRRRPRAGDHRARCGPWSPSTTPTSGRPGSASA